MAQDVERCIKEEMTHIHTFGSICSGIEAASFVLEPLGIKPVWLSEIADFQSRLLALKHPGTDNLGDMNDIPQMIEEEKIKIPDMLCGGTPCQAFSLAGWRNGINDDRGQLTLKYIDIIDAIDKKRLEKGLERGIFFWENVEGALTDKTNAFGCFLAGLLGLEESIDVKKWPSAGFVSGKERNIAWRVLDAKYFGVPQQRKRIYLLGGGKNFHPENVLFEQGDIFEDPLKPTNDKQLSLFDSPHNPNATSKLTRVIHGHELEAFRSYSDCLYAAYGTKWNGNAAAFNGSLFLSQDGRLRRLTPMECERLMGFPDDYTKIAGCRDTQRYQAVGNSWAIPVVDWIAKRLVNDDTKESSFEIEPTAKQEDYALFLLNDFMPMRNGYCINASKMPYAYKLTNLLDIATTDVPEKFYITNKGCSGILRRKKEHNAGMNKRLEKVLSQCSNYPAYV